MKRRILPVGMAVAACTAATLTAQTFATRNDSTSTTSTRDAAAIHKFTELEVRANTGLGAEKATAH
jgi:hypothetical protein